MMLLPYGDQNPQGPASSKNLGFGLPDLIVQDISGVAPLTAAIKPLLPTDGMKILNEPAYLTKQATPEADALLKSLMTPAVQQAIIAVTADKYLQGIKPLLDADRAKKLADVTSFEARLRVWPILNKVFLLASNEQDGAEQQKAIQDAVQLALLWLPNTTAGDKVARDGVTSLPALIAAVKAAEVVLLKAQSAVTVGTDWALSEYRLGTAPDTEHCAWYGPVAVRERVALKGVYPIPDIWKPWQDKSVMGKTATTWGAWYNNPVIYNSDFAGLADYMPFSAYDYQGMNTGQADFLGWDGGYKVSASGTERTVDIMVKIYDFWKKYAGSPDLNAVTHILNIIAGRLGVGSPLVNGKGTPFPLGAFIQMGLWVDPNWNGGVTQFFTPHQVADLAVIGQIRNVHDAIRAKLSEQVMSPNPDGTVSIKPVGAYAKVKYALGAVQAAITAIVFHIPPVELNWVQVGNNTVLTPVSDLLKWKNGLYGMASGVTYNSNLGAMIEQSNNDAWAGKGPTYKQILDDLTNDKSVLNSWIPSNGGPLPYPFVYPADPLMVSLVPQAAAVAKKALAGLDAGQQVLVEAAASSKATTLCAMWAAQLGSGAEYTVEEMIKELMALAQELYGCDLPLPVGVKAEDKLAFYTNELKKCTANPDPKSLAGKINALIKQYAEVKKEADKGNSEALKKMTTLSAQISALQTDMAALVDSRGSRRARSAEKTLGEGGTVSFVNKSKILLGKPAIVVKIGDKEVKIDLTPEQAKAKAETEAKNGKTIDGAESMMSYVAGSGIVLKELINKFGLPVSQSFSDQITENIKKTTDFLPKKAESSPWLLILAAVGLYAANRK